MSELGLPDDALAASKGVTRDDACNSDSSRELELFARAAQPVSADSAAVPTYDRLRAMFPGVVEQLRDEERLAIEHAEVRVRDEFGDVDFELADEGPLARGSQAKWNDNQPHREIQIPCRIGGVELIVRSGEVPGVYGFTSPRRYSIFVQHIPESAGPLLAGDHKLEDVADLICAARRQDLWRAQLAASSTTAVDGLVAEQRPRARSPKYRLRGMM